MSNLFRKNKQDEDEDYLKEQLYTALSRKFTSR
jgi:hypothetical protein